MTNSAAKPHLSRDHMLDLLGRLIRLRRFAAKCAELHSAGKIHGFLQTHDDGETIAAGVLSALGPDDRVVATAREHAQALMRGIPMGDVLAEMFGKAEGCSGGRGGSLHLFSRAHHFHGGNAVTGGGLPLAVGLALGDKLRGEDRITACFFGEETATGGEVHECLNLAALWKLPVLFICETRIAGMDAAGTMETGMVDGMDVVAVESATRTAVAQIITTGRPRLLQCQVDGGRASVEDGRAREPAVIFQTWLDGNGLLRHEDVARLERAADEEIEAAVAFAGSGSREPVETLERFIVADQRPPAPQAPAPAEMVRTTYREAVRAAIIEAMERDTEVVLMSEGASHYGVRHSVNKELLERFGPERVRDTPLSQSSITGASTGAAIAGLRPIVEASTANFPLRALDMMVNTAASLRYMSNGQFGVPLVIRMVTDAATRQAHSLEGWFARIPGIRVLAPVTLEDARGMLWTALQDPDPVLILENATLHDREGEIAANAGAVDIDRAAVRRPGHDISLVTYGGALFKALAAAEELARDGIEAEVIDLRVLRPLDTATIIGSVSRTRRVLIVDEGWRTGSLAAEIGMRIAEDAFYELDAPIARLCGAEVPLPYARHLAEAAVPQTATIVARVRAMFGRF